MSCHHPYHKNKILFYDKFLLRHTIVYMPTVKNALSLFRHGVLDHGLNYLSGCGDCHGIDFPFFIQNDNSRYILNLIGIFQIPPLIRQYDKVGLQFIDKQPDFFRTFTNTDGDDFHAFGFQSWILFFQHHHDRPTVGAPYPPNNEQGRFMFPDDMPGKCIVFPL